MWLNNLPLSAEVCARNSELKDRGFYRKLNTGKFEFISFCHKNAASWVSIPKKDFEEMLNKYLPENEVRDIMATLPFMEFD